MTTRWVATIAAVLLVGSLVKPATIRHSIRLGARARAAIKRHPRARLVLRTTLRLPSGRAIHATKTLTRRG